MALSENPMTPLVDFVVLDNTDISFENVRNLADAVEMVWVGQDNMDINTILFNTFYYFEDKLIMICLSTTQTQVK